MSEPDIAIPDILVVFCHPLHFQEARMRSNFIEELNRILTYENLKIEASDTSSKITYIDEMAAFSEKKEVYKTYTDYLSEAINFFKNEYGKVKIPGLQYEYFLGEFLGGSEYSDEYYDKLKVAKRLKEAGVIREYKIEPFSNEDGIWIYALCKIDENKLFQKEKSSGVEPKAQDLVHKIEITAMPELTVKNTEENTLIKGKKRLHLPRFQPTDWSEITIRFSDERNVLIKAGKKDQAISDFEALGFSDEKRDKPNLAWKFFYELARNNGETGQLQTPIPDNIKQQKRQLSDRLRTIFKNDTDPFYDPTDSRVYKIKIKLIPPQSDNERPDVLGIQEHIKETMPDIYDKDENEGYKE